MKDKTIPEIFFKREGRLNRLRYFKRNLVIALIMFVAMVVVSLIFVDDEGNFLKIVNIIAFILGLATVVPSYCLMVRRLHDMDKDAVLANAYAVGCVGGYILKFILEYEFMPLDIVLMIVLLYVLFVPGTHGANRYGADPLA